MTKLREPGPTRTWRQQPRVRRNGNNGIYQQRFLAVASHRMLLDVLARVVLRLRIHRQVA
jgi:hypothetical protein